MHQLNRYIRKLYPDPNTANIDWGLAMSTQGGFIGVYSHSDDNPIKKNFDELQANFERVDQYNRKVLSNGHLTIKK